MLLIQVKRFDNQPEISAQRRGSAVAVTDVMFVIKMITDDDFCPVSSVQVSSAGDYKLNCEYLNSIISSLNVFGQILKASPFPCPGSSQK